MVDKQQKLLNSSKVTTTLKKRIGSGNKKFSEKVSLKFVPHDIVPKNMHDKDKAESEMKVVNQATNQKSNNTTRQQA